MLLRLRPALVAAVSRRKSSSLSGVFGEQVLHYFEGATVHSTTRQPTFLDLTFGSGGHTRSLLEHFPGKQS